MVGNPTKSSIGTPVAEILIDAPLVSRLLALQFPHLSHLPLQEADSGWDNALFHLGANLAVRLPRRAAAAKLIVNEQTYLPILAPNLPVDVPAPCHIGSPALGYPWNWSIVPWLKGVTADGIALGERHTTHFSAFLRALHVPAPINAPSNPFRGVPLCQRAPAVEQRLERLAQKTSIITPQLRHVWEQALAAPLDVKPTWLHGDLHPRNILVERNRISAVIDWGDITAGDCATDLASIWMLFDSPQKRERALAAYRYVSTATLQRARGWAILFGVMFLETGLEDNQQNAAIGEKTLRRVLDPI